MPSISYGGTPDISEWFSISMVNVDTMPTDGWITDISIHICAANSGDTANYRLAVYEAASREFISPVAGASFNGGSPQAKSASCDLRVNSGHTLRWGIGIQSTPAFISFSNVGSHNVNYNETGTPPSPWSSDGTFSGSALRGTLTYLANVAPTTPTWRTPSSNGATVAQTPTLEGNLNQGADAAYDTIEEYNLQVYVLSTGITVLDTTFATTSAERAQGYFSRSISGLTGGTTYGARFRTKDSWGVWSASFSAERTFTTVQGPNEPTPVSPLGKINAISGTPYVATHSHPGGLSANAAQVIVTNSTGSQLYDSGTVVVSVAPGANVSVAEWHADLSWGTGYQWKMRVRDTSNNWGPYTTLQSFQTDAAPNMPVGLSPANNQVTSSAVFGATATDPDGDPISLAQIEIALVSTGATVSGYPASMTVNAATGALSYTAPASPTSGFLTLGNQYKWRARANDGLGPGYGAWSEWAFFTYAAVPAVTLIAPMNNRSNMIAQPSAEYDTTDLSTYWTVTNAGGGGQSISRVADDNSPYGAFQWRSVGDSSGAITQETTNYITIDGTKALAAFVWARTISGTPSLTFAILCYNSSNTLVGTLNPQSLSILNATQPSSVWTRYGGILMQIGAGFGTVLPAGTVKVKLRVQQASSTGTAAFDAISMGQLPLNPATATERDRAQEWLGYADGDSIGFGEDGYSWTGVAGDSISSIQPILAKAASGGANVVFNYTHPGSSAKSNDRLIIEKYLNGAYSDLYDSNPNWSTSNGSRTLIPLPSGVIQNEGRYRLKVIARDAILLEGDSGFTEFDVYYTGPAQLDIVIAEALPAKAQNRLVWNPSALTPSAFAGIEVQRIDLSGDEETVTLEVISDPTETEFIDHFPAANKLYSYRVRQIEQVGLDQVGGLWATQQISCDYYPYTFLKDVEDPTIITAYETEAQNLVGYEGDKPVGILAPWGASRPTVLSRSKLETKTGQVAGGFFTDAGIEIPGFLSPDERFDAAAKILKRRRTVAILIPAPEIVKVFAAIIGPARTTFPYPPLVRGVEFSWQEVSYSEDFYERAGLE